MARKVRQPPRKPFPIVGIGASAGGLESFRQMLAALPVDTGMGFVFVQHLDPTHESRLTELLSRSTRLPVIEVANRMAVKPNHVYVIPPDRSLAISDGVLKLTPRNRLRGPNMPIDAFLHSLATERGTLAIGVILSGTATDGAEGLKAIKVEGGITFAQDESSAKYIGMPRAAIATGAVDFMLPPAAIARELGRISRHPYVNHLPPGPGAEGEEEGGGDLARIFLEAALNRGEVVECRDHYVRNRSLGNAQTSGD